MEVQTIHYIEIHSALRELPTMYSALRELQIIPYIQMHSALRELLTIHYVEMHISLGELQTIHYRTL